MPNRPGSVLECQDCGAVVRRLSPAEAQKVSYNPYDFVVYCTPCRQLQEGIDRLHDY